jgi:2-iminobutanoate/2-iminopropanoate deaminase
MTITGLGLRFYWGISRGMDNQGGCMPTVTETTIEAIRSDRLSPPVGPFSPAVRAGDFIFFSGQVGQDPATGKLVEGGVEAEARQLLSNLATLLDTAGKSFRDVVMARVFLTRIEDFAAVNAIYAEQFEPPFPSRTTIGVAALPLGASVEVELLVRA